ncbi:MAG: PIG-L deacetylase family protein [Gammaproteobacteria bacterium]
MRRLLRWAYRRFIHPTARNSLRVSLLLTARDRPPEPITDFGCARVLVLAPHMDDETLGCGGSLVRHIEQGAQVTVVFMTDGRWGDARLFENNLSAAEIDQRQQVLIVTRQDEARQATAILGIHDPVFLNATDGALRPDAAIVAGLADVILQYLPDIVYLPFVMDLHEDHWQTNRVFLECLSRLPPHLHKRLCLRGYEVWTPLIANCLADISAQMPRKLQALAIYRSQLKDVNYLRAVESLNAYRSVNLGKGEGFAEAFYQCSVPEYQELMRQIGQ